MKIFLIVACLLLAIFVIAYTRQSDWSSVANSEVLSLGNATDTDVESLVIEAIVLKLQNGKVDSWNNLPFHQRNVYIVNACESRILQLGADDYLDHIRRNPDFPCAKDCSEAYLAMGMSASAKAILHVRPNFEAEMRGALNSLSEISSRKLYIRSKVIPSIECGE